MAGRNFLVLIILTKIYLMVQILLSLSIKDTDTNALNVIKRKKSALGI